MTASLRTFCSVLTLVAALAAGPSASASTELDELIEVSGLSGSFLAARSATFANDDAAAVGFLQKALEHDPENQRLKRNLYHAYLANGRVADAVELSRGIDAEGEDASVMIIVNAVDHLRQRAWPKVADSLGELNGSELDQFVSKIVSAWAMAGEGRQEEAVALIDSIHGPHWMRIIKHFHVGLLHSSAGDDEAAVASFDEALDIQNVVNLLPETFIRIVDAKARAQLRAGAIEPAGLTVEQALEIFPNHPTFHALIEAIDGDRKLAPLVTTPQQGAAELFFDIGNAISRDGTQFAQIYLQIARHLHPDNDAVALSLAAVFERQRRPARANAEYERIGDESPFKRRALLETAINMNTMDDVEGSIATLRELIDKEPGDLIGYMTLGRVLSQHERYGEAAEVFDTATTRIMAPQRRHWDLFYRRGIAYERLKDWEKAEPNFKQALTLYPDQPHVLNYLGYSWVDMGVNLDEAMDMIRKAVELRPQSGFIIDSLGWAYYRLGRYDEAVRELERAITLMPGDPVINDHLGDAYWQVGRRLEATFQWRHALDSDPEPEDEARIRRKLETGLIGDGEEPLVKADQENQDQ